MATALVRIGPVLVLAMSLLALPRHALADGPSPVTMRVSVGYDGYYGREGSWTPVRVTLQSRSADTIAGSVDLGDLPAYYPGQGLQPERARYRMEVVLPAGATKQLTLYVPSEDIPSAIEVTFHSGDGSASSVWSEPTQWDETSISVGVLTGDPAAIMWLRRVHAPGNLALVHLTPAELDPIPEALAAFDMIVLTNVDTATLNEDQWSGLEQYVDNGGTLLLVGGPDWQETLLHVPASLLPGHLTGTQTLPDLSALRSLGAGSPPRGLTTVSVLSGAQGYGMDTASGLPLVVRMQRRSGEVEYLAFDPALDPIAHWRAGGGLLTRLVTDAVPLAVERMELSDSLSRGAVDSSNYDPQDWRLDTSLELANTPIAQLPPPLPLIGAVVLYFILRKGMKILVRVRWPHRTDLNSPAVSALTLLLLAPPAALLVQFKDRTVLVNTISTVLLDGRNQYPATTYLSLFSSLPGSYHLQEEGSALPASDEQPSTYDLGSSTIGLPVGWTFTEGNPTQVDFLSTGYWSTRAVALRGSVSLPGTVTGELHLTPNGDVVGTIHNGTGLSLLQPALVAGSTAIRLPSMPPGATVQAHIRPGVTPAPSQDLLPRVYGRSIFSSHDPLCAVAPSLPVPGALGSPSEGEGADCVGPWLPKEDTLMDRIRNAIAMLGESRIVPTLGDVTFVAWTDRPLTAITVGGITPQRRDLAMIVKPLTVTLPRGRFHLQLGTLTPHLMSLSPGRALHWCVDPLPQAISLGEGGSATFEFDLPRAGSLRFSSLKLGTRLVVALDGAEGTCSAPGASLHQVVLVYDWGTGRWMDTGLRDGLAGLSAARRFVSPTGVLLVRVQATAATGDVIVHDPHQDLQLSGEAVVR